jgi:hypothetical protein
MIYTKMSIYSQGSPYFKGFTVKNINSSQKCAQFVLISKILFFNKNNYIYNHNSVHLIQSLS